MIGEVGKFFSPSELFLYSRVNSIWHRNLVRSKQKVIKKIRRDIYQAHCCDNICPCVIEKCGLSPSLCFLIPNYNLARYACSELNIDEAVPDWFMKL